MGKFMPKPWTVGKVVKGVVRHPNIIFDANEESVAQLYGIPVNLTREEVERNPVRKLDLQAADDLVKAINLHDELVKALKTARRFIQRELIEHAVVHMSKPNVGLGAYLDTVIKKL